MVSTTMTKTDFVSIREAAKYLGISRAAVWKAVSEGRLAAQRVDTFHIIRKSELKKYRVNEIRKLAGDTRKKKKSKKP
jgi:excisionase family DNA binding protein